MIAKDCLNNQVLKEMCVGPKYRSLASESESSDGEQPKAMNRTFPTDDSEKNVHSRRVDSKGDDRISGSEL